jgi:hypothetical protein
MPVVLANLYLIDTLRVAVSRLPRAGFCALANFGCGAGWHSQPRIPSNRAARSSPSTQRLQHSVKRPKLTAADRFFWAWLAATWRNWRSALIIVQPETVIGWHPKRDSAPFERGNPVMAVEAGPASAVSFWLLCLIWTAFTIVRNGLHPQPAPGPLQYSNAEQLAGARFLALLIPYLMAILESTAMYCLLRKANVVNQFKSLATHI